jgi:hypothetical protein
MKYQYLTKCIDSDGPSITAMVDRARTITFRTFARNCDWQPIAHQLGYITVPGKGLHLDEDYAVSFHRSRFKDPQRAHHEFQWVRCYYLRWSAIEYIFVRPNT